jgi:dTMP kinase
MASPAFVVFEGGEGSGKSTQAKALTDRLRKVGYNVVLTREPGGTQLGDKLRRWLKWGKDVTVPTELLLFLASRSQLVTNVIRPALDADKIVICDRFAASTFAYQGHARGIDISFLESLNDFATGGLEPDLVLLMDLEADEGLARKRRRWDSFEREDFSFHQKVREGYLGMAAANPGKWVIIDASLPEFRISEQVWEQVKEHLIYGKDSPSLVTSSP